MGNIVGEHQVIISTDSQTITLKHEAHDRPFAEGAGGGGVLINKPAGLYNMQDVVAEEGLGIMNTKADTRRLGRL